MCSNSSRDLTRDEPATYHDDGFFAGILRIITPLRDNIAPMSDVYLEV